MDAREAARDYIRRGWAVVDVPARSKAPTRRDWQHARLTADEIDPGGNIGLLLGASSGGLVDVDLDAAEAIAAAPFFLPKTGRRHGRASKPMSHHWFTIADEPSLRSIKFVDPARTQNGKKCTLVELRANSEKGTPLQTIVPPSVHPDGELITWDGEGEPAPVTASELRIPVARIAACALIAWRWPDGARHDAALALAGLLLRGGMAKHDVERFVEAVARVVGDEQWRDRVRAVSDTAKTIADGGAATGGPRLAELLQDGEVIVAKVRDWLGLSTADADTAPRVLDLAEFLAFEFPPRENIMDPVFPHFSVPCSTD